MNGTPRVIECTGGRLVPRLVEVPWNLPISVYENFYFAQKWELVRQNASLEMRWLDGWP